LWSCPGFVDSATLGGRKESTMAKRRYRRAYPAEFRQEMVRLVRGGRSPEELSREFEPSAQAIRLWVAQTDRDEGRRQDGLTSDERLELQQLRRENARLREEREILKKAAAWFARETGTIPPGSSHS
jgi:transposase